MRTSAALVALTLFACGYASAEGDPEFVRMWEEAQKERPAEISTRGRIAPDGEPGQPMRIRGTAFLQDGRTPAAGVVIFAYQTDARGLYHEEGALTWRLRGWVRTDGLGRFEFLTIRPGSYPSRSTPAHVHFTMEGKGLSRRWTTDLEFADDPLLTAAQRSRSSAAGRFGSIRPVARGESGVEAVEIHLRSSDENRF
jgi:protocatechuate 3,4-dioxygenase, beta subunit